MIKTALFSLFIATALYSVDTNQTKVTKLSEDTLFQASREYGLSLHDSLNRAIELSPKMGAAKELVIQDKMRLDESFAGHLPIVSISGDAGYEARDIKEDATENPSAVTNHQKYKKVDLYLTISENLWNGGSIQDSVDAKEASLNASLYDYRDKLESLVVEMATAYFELVYSEIALKISKKNMQNYEKILNIVSIKEQNGAATKGDVNFIRANVDNAKTEYVQKQQAQSDALAKYNYLLQTQEPQMLPYETETALYVSDLNTSLEDAQKYNAQLLRQEEYIKATHYTFLASEGKFHPKVDFSINGETRNDYDTGLGKRDKINALVTFNYNLYNGGKDEAAAIRLLSAMQEQKFLHQDIQRNLVFDIKVLSRSVSSLNDSLHLTEQEVLAAREVVESYWISFQHGTQDLQALQLAQRNLNRAEQDYANYKRDLILNNFELMKKSGVLLQFLNIAFSHNPEAFKEDDKLFSRYYELGL
ncbi:MAG: TolC family protein [Campylobacterales bacterium]|nr:TolC family protein [Campylobacterales bacterium]